MPSEKTLRNIELLKDALNAWDNKMFHARASLTNAARHMIAIDGRYTTAYYYVTDSRLANAVDFDAMLAEVLANPQKKTVVTFDPREIYIKSC